VLPREMHILLRYGARHLRESRHVGRIGLLHFGEGYSAVQYGKTSARPDGHERLRLPDRQHGPSPLRDVPGFRERHVPPPPRPWSGLRSTVPGRADHPRTAAAVLPDQA
ncbi:unnamed protein product, partial [Nesidiocoris tenuis]